MDETHRERPPGDPDDNSDDDSGDPLIGRGLGEFVVRERLGAGGHGAVYLAEQPLLDRQAVIKVLHAELRSDQSLVQRFSREARLASRIDHPYAAHIYAFGAEPEGLMWIAMEYVQGTPLDAWLRDQGAMAPERFAPLLERLCEVVHHAHGRGVVHRDLKPGNIMLLSRAGRLLPKLLDLGIARVVEQVVPTAANTSSTVLARLDTSNLPAASEGLETLATDTPERKSNADAALLATLASEPEPGPDAAAADVTRSGTILGSPPYMAPEQWLDASNVDARTDIYALGVLTYEALTGTRPFVANHWPALLRAHVDDPPPPLGHGLPGALDAVVQRALAKKPGDRWQTPIEMSAALSAALGGGHVSETRPRLDPALRDLLVAEAPAPIADSVGALAAATHVWQACAALECTRDALVRTVAVIALAAHRARPTAVDGARLGELTAELAASRHDHHTWLGLARTLVAPWADRPELHPVPELVEVLVERDASPGPLTRSAQILGGDTLASVLRDPDADRDTLSRALADALEHLADALRTAEPLFAWRWVLARDENTGELWMGTARPPRSVAVRGALAGRLVLVDTLDRAALELSPLADVARPTPGAPPVVFLFDGWRRDDAWTLSAPPRGFELPADPTLEHWLDDALALSRPGSDTPDAPRADTAPWPGLAAYDRDDAGRFFGREAEVATARNQLRIEPLLVVVGPSGSGKSSFVQAGLLPALDRGTRILTVRPGADPRAALDQPGRRAGAPPWGMGGEPAHAQVVFVDQFEELFTLGADEADVHAFVTELLGAVRTVDDPVRVVITLRDDFLGRAQALPGLGERLARGMLLLGTPGRDALRRILVEPARRAGLTFEDDALVDEMIAAVAGRPGALPLLSFAASRLWAARDGAVLTRAAYLSMGGVGGALASHAEETLATLSAGQRALVRRAFARLITSEGTRAVPTRASLEQTLGGDAAARRVVEALVAARLLVVYDDLDADDAERVEIAHEALLSAWPRLVRWRREDSEQTRLREQLEQAARQWDTRDRQRGLLWRDAALTELELWLDRDDGALAEALDARERAFVEASRAETRRARMLKRLALALVVIGLAVGLALQWRATRRTEAARVVAEAERQRAERSASAASLARQQAELRATEAAAAMARLNEDQGRRALLDGEPARAWQLLEAAEAADGQRTPVRGLLMDRARAALDAELARLEGHRLATPDVVVTPDGQLAVSASWDRTARIWALDAGDTAVVLPPAAGRLEGVTLSPAGDRVVLYGEDAAPRLFNLPNGAAVSTLTGHAAGPIRAVAFSPDGQRVVTGGRDGTAIVHRMITGEPLRVLEGHTDAVEAVAWEPSGRWLATGGAGGRILLHDMTETQLGAPEQDVAAAPEGSLALEPLGSAVTALTFSPDGTRLIAASASGLIAVWAPTSPDPEAPDETPPPWSLGAVLEGHLAAVDGLAVRDDGRRLLSWSADGTARVWSLGLRPREMTRLTGHDGPIHDAVFLAGGRRIATAGEDGTVRVFDAETGDVIAVRRGHAGRVSALAARPGLAEVVSVGQDATVRRWRTSPDGLLATLHMPDDDTADGARNPALAVTRWLDAESVVAAARLTGARWTLTPAVERTATLAGRFEQTVSAVATDATTAWLGGRDGTLIRWPVSGEPVELTDDAAAGKSHTRGVLGIVPRPGHDGQVVSLGADGRIKLWSSASSTPLASVEAHGDVVVDAAWTPDGATLVTASGARESRARVWRVDAAGRPEPVHLLEGHRAALTSVDVDADGALAVTASADKVALVWSVASGVRLTELRGHEGRIDRARFDPAGTRIATASADGTVRLWRASDGEVLTVLDGHDDAVLDVAWHPSAPVLASASADGTVRLWQPDDGQLLAVLPGHGRLAGELAFSPDGSRLLASSADGDVQVWRLAAPEAPPGVRR